MTEPMFTSGPPFAVPAPGALLSPEVFWVGAALGGFAYVITCADRMGLDRRVAYWAGVVTVLGGMLGGHALSQAQNAMAGIPTAAWWAFWVSTGSSIGTIAGGTIAGVLFLRARGRRVLPYADAAAPGAALAYGIGRIGCLFNGDDFGVLTSSSVAVRFPPGTLAYADHLTRGWIAPGDPLSLPVHPVQLYSAAVGFVLFWWLRSRAPAPIGRQAGTLALCYGAARLILEPLRGDRTALLGAMSIAQLAALLLVLLGGVLLLLPVLRRRGRINGLALESQ